MHILYLELVLARVIEEGGREGEGQSSVGVGGGASERASCARVHAWTCHCHNLHIYIQFGILLLFINRVTLLMSNC